MKTYVETATHLRIGTTVIPKEDGNGAYEDAKRERAAGAAEFVAPPEPSAGEVKTRRIVELRQLLSASDAGMARVTEELAVGANLSTKAQQRIADRRAWRQELSQLEG